MGAGSRVASLTQTSASQRPAEREGVDKPASLSADSSKEVINVASLYELLGEIKSIRSVVDSFVGRCASDDRINRKFERSDIPRLRNMLVDQVCEATGGPCTTVAAT
jgi:Bacterial-like globin